MDSWFITSLMQDTTFSLVSHCFLGTEKGIYFYPAIGLWDLKAPFLACITVNIITGPLDLFSMLAPIFDLLTCSRRWQIPQADDTLGEKASPVMETFDFAE